MKLSSGYVIVGTYADKIRRTLFAQMKNAIKSEEIDSKEVARAAAELDRLLYEVFVNKVNYLPSRGCPIITENNNSSRLCPPPIHKLDR